LPTANAFPAQGSAQPSLSTYKTRSSTSISFIWAPIEWNFNLLSMAFWRHDHHVKWTGMSVVPAPQALALSSDNLLQLLLSEFVDVFAEPIGLPPPRPFDHRIHLLPSTPPVDVQPY
jgi:hypothetical protein